MKYPEIRSAVKHLMKTSKCPHCEGKFKEDNIHVIATTKAEGLFEMKCPGCTASTIVSVFLAPENEVLGEQSIRTHGGISHDDVLDMKNFLSKFDGNFKKIFPTE